MQEKWLRQNINDRIGRRIKDPSVIIKKDAMEHHEEAIKIHCHQKGDHDRNNNCDPKWLNQLPQRLLFN